MNAREIQKLLIKPAIPYLADDFRIVKGNFLIKYPIKDIITGFCFGRSSDKNDFYLHAFSQPLYLLHDYFHLTFGDRIKDRKNIDSWSLIDRPKFTKNTIEEVISALQNNLSFVEEMRNPEKFYLYIERALKRYENLRFDEARVYTAFWIKREDAMEQAKEYIEYLNTKENLTIEWRKDIRDRIQELVDSTDPIAILQKNKEQTIKNLKL